MLDKKPLRRKAYGSIPHLPGSRLGPGDHHIHPGQARIATEAVRDKHDLVIVQEKLDGSCVSVAKVNGVCVPLTRKGYIANTSEFKLHHDFYEWANNNIYRFDNILAEGERICGEWLGTPHGTLYRLVHEPFVAFDIFDCNNNRIIYDEFYHRVNRYLYPLGFVVPGIVSYGHQSVSIENAMEILCNATKHMSIIYADQSGFHGAIDPVEGAIWRVERNGKFDFICKYVRPDKVDGKYLDK